MARHRQFAEAAERKKGGKRPNDSQSKANQVSQARDQPESAATPAIRVPVSLGYASPAASPATQTGGIERARGLTPPALAALSIKRRQSIAPAHLEQTLKLSPRRAVSLFQTSIGKARLPAAEPSLDDRWRFQQRLGGCRAASPTAHAIGQFSNACAKRSPETECRWRERIAERDVGNSATTGHCAHRQETRRWRRDAGALKRPAVMFLSAIPSARRP